MDPWTRPHQYFDIVYVDYRDPDHEHVEARPDRVRTAEEFEALCRAVEQKFGAEGVRVRMRNGTLELWPVRRGELMSDPEVRHDPLETGQVEYVKLQTDGIESGPQFDVLFDGKCRELGVGSDQRGYVYVRDEQELFIYEI